MQSVCWTSLSGKLVDTLLEFKDIYLMLSFLAHYLYSMLVDLLTQFVRAKMTELKNWSKSLLAEYGFWKKTMYVMDIALYQSC